MCRAIPIDRGIKIDAIRRRGSAGTETRVFLGNHGRGPGGGREVGDKRYKFVAEKISSYIVVR